MNTSLLPSGISTLILCAANLLLWNTKHFFFLPASSYTASEQASIYLPRTADDIARGLLAQPECFSADEKQKILPLLKRGAVLRSTISQKQSEHRFLEEKLLRQIGELK